MNDDMKTEPKLGPNHYRKRPVVIEARQFTGENGAETIA